MQEIAPEHPSDRRLPLTRRRPDRTGRGIGVPSTLWLPPADTTPHNPTATTGVLPTWALRRVVTEYAVPHHSVVAVDSRGAGVENRILAYQPLPACHDPHAATRPRPRRGHVDLAVLEIHTSRAEPADPGQPALLHGFVHPALRAAACHLAPGAILAIALSSPDPGRPASSTSRVLAMAAEHGFSFQQHLVVVTAEIVGDRLIPRLTPAQTTAVSAARSCGIPAPAAAHLDLVIATRNHKEPRA